MSCSTWIWSQRTTLLRSPSVRERLNERGEEVCAKADVGEIGEVREEPRRGVCQYLMLGELANLV